jgi:type IV pilus assembly protein PilP
MKIRSVLIAASCLSLTACFHDMSDLEQYVAQVKAHKTTRIEPLPQMKPYEAFIYVAAGRRDPFIPMAPTNPNGQGNSALRPDMNRNREPLEEFPLDALKMVGTLLFNNQTYAMVKAPDGVVHRVTMGNHMGQNYGKIIKIEPSAISLTEIVPDGFGGWTERPASLAMSD